MFSKSFPEKMENFKKELYDCLNDNIMRYWIDRMTDPRGGFYGRRDGYDVLDADAPKGAILNARILWSFAAAYRLTHNEEYRDMALRARDYVRDHFIDRQYGGVYWSLDADGTPLDTRKQFYAIAFTIYGLSEHYRATGDEESLRLARELFNDIESHSRDTEKGGYIEAETRDWQPIADMRLSDKDDNASKTMNTHLHIMEGYTSLLRVWRDPALLEATTGLLRIFLDRILDSETGHLGLFFNDDWERQDGIFSYGHDIEASWLMLETAMVIGDKRLYEETLAATARIAEAALEGRRADGSMIYERHADGTLDEDLHWWVQAEDVIGQLYLAAYHGKPEFIEWAADSWRFIREKLIDRENGEWYWSRLGKDGSIDRADDKAGFWKCPYHNSRMCIEAIETLDKLS